MSSFLEAAEAKASDQKQPRVKKTGAVGSKQL